MQKGWTWDKDFVSGSNTTKRLGLGQGFCVWEQHDKKAGLGTRILCLGVVWEREKNSIGMVCQSLKYNVVGTSTLIPYESLKYNIMCKLPEIRKIINFSLNQLTLVACVPRFCW